MARVARADMEALGDEVSPVYGPDEDVTHLPGFIGKDDRGRLQFVEAFDAASVCWRPASYWARKARGIRLRAAQVACGAGRWDEIASSGGLVEYKWTVVSDHGAPWIGSLVGKHGRYATYVNWECRCGRCRAAHESYGSDYRAGVVTGESGVLPGYGGDD